MDVEGLAAQKFILVKKKKKNAQTVRFVKCFLIKDFLKTTGRKRHFWMPFTALSFW